MGRLSSASRVFARVSVARDARGGSRSWSAEVFVRRAALGGGRAEASRGSGSASVECASRVVGARAARRARPRAVRGRGRASRGRRGRERRRPARTPARRSRSIPSPRYGRAREILHRGRASRPARACARDARASRAARRGRLDAGRGRRPRAGVRARRLEAPFAARARKGAGVRPPSRAVGECGGKARAGRPRKKDHLDPEIGEVRARKMSFTGRASFSRIRAGTGRSFLVPRASPRRARARASS